LLLWSDVNSIPNRIMNLDVFKDNVSDLSSSTSSWIGLDVNSLHRVLEVDFIESNSSNAVVVRAGID